MKVISPIRWVGGKSKLCHDIVNIMPEHKCYVEVFGGGLWVLFNKPKSSVEIINDINSELINFWKTVQNNYDEFINECKYLLVSRDLFEEYKNTDISNLSELERAIRFFYINRTCFGGDMDKPRFGTANSRRSSLCCITDDVNAFMFPIYKRIKDVCVENLNWNNLILKYDERLNIKTEQSVLYYVDPPYVETKGYENKFTNDNHVELANMLKSINGKFILTINNHPFVYELYNGFNMIDKEVNYTICKDNHGMGHRKELIITNYDIKQ